MLRPLPRPPSPLSRPLPLTAKVREPTRRGTEGHRDSSLNGGGGDKRSSPGRGRNFQGAPQVSSPRQSKRLRSIASTIFQRRNQALRAPPLEYVFDNRRVCGQSLQLSPEEESSASRSSPGLRFLPRVFDGRSVCGQSLQPSSRGGIKRFALLPWNACSTVGGFAVNPSNRLPEEESSASRSSPGMCIHPRVFDGRRVCGQSLQSSSRGGIKRFALLPWNVHPPPGFRRSKGLRSIPSTIARGGIKRFALLPGHSNSRAPQKISGRGCQRRENT
jgi:hypothetical protein